MRSIQFAIATLAIVTGNVAAFATTNQDTVKVIENPQRVIITEDSTGSHITVLSKDAEATNNNEKGVIYNYNVAHQGDAQVNTTQKSSDWNLRFPFQRVDTAIENKHHWSLILDGFYFGFGWPNVKSGVPAFKNNIGHEYEFGVMNLIGLQYSTNHKQYISFGFGIETRRYHMHNEQIYLFKDEHDMIDVTTFPDGAGKRSSNLCLTSLQFPLIFRQSVGNFKFSVAGIMNINVGGSISNHYRLGDNDFDITTKNIGQRKITFDVMGGICYKALGLYVRYRPQNVLKNGRGPQFNTLSTGIILGF